MWFKKNKIFTSSANRKSDEVSYSSALPKMINKGTSCERR
jgi:hypothetical protein